MRPQKWQRNQIYEAVVAGGLDVSACTFDYDDVKSRITHVPSQSIFLIQDGPSPYIMTAIVGDNQSWPLESFTWSMVPEKVQRWAGEVTRDVDTPDLWSDLRRKQGILTGAGYEGVENTPFTQHEQEEILEQLREVKELVKKTGSLSEAQTLSIETKLDDIAVAAGRVGRKDWQLMFGGLILSLIIERLLPPDARSGVIEMVSNGLGHLFGGNELPQLPPLTPPAPPPVV